MGFRFSRRIKILPGLSLNLSKSGVSLSAGVRGARINFGRRGTYGTVGIPGTGLSYRQRLDSVASGQPDSVQGELRSVNVEELRRYRDNPNAEIRDPRTNRKLSLRQIDARIKEMEVLERKEAALGRIEEETRKLNGLINFWRPLPEIESLEAVKATLRPYPFESQLVAPTGPDWLAEEREFLRALTDAQKEHWPFRFLPAFFARRSAGKKATALWPVEQKTIQQRHLAAVDQYQQQLVEEERAWTEQESVRVAWLSKLLNGDLDEIYSTATNTITGLNFPFDTSCDLFLQDAYEIFAHIDLPEIENVIPAKETTVLKSGDTKKVLRDPR